MLGLTKDSFDFTKTIGIAAFALCIVSSFLFNLGSDIWERQLHGPIFHLICIIVGATVIPLWIFKRELFSIKIIDIYVLVFLGYMLCRSIKESYPFVDPLQFYSYLSYGIIYILIRLMLKADYLNREVISVLLIVALVNVLAVALQLFKIIPLYNRMQIVSGLFVNPGLLGGFIASIIPLILTLQISTNKAKLIKGILILILAATLILSSSRAAFIAAIAPFIICYVPWFKIIKSKYVWVYFGIILCAAAFLIFKLYHLNPYSVQGRMLIWKVSFQMFFEKPVFGHGSDGFIANYNTYQGQYFDSSMGTPTEKMLAGTIYTPFNEYLRISIEGGIVGIFLFSLIILQLVRVIRLVKQEFIPVFLSIFSILIFSLFSYPFAVETNSCIFFALLALVPSKTIYLKSFNPKVVWLIVPVFIFISAPTLRFINSIQQWRAASPMWDYNEYQALREYNRVSSDLSSNWTFTYNYGAELLRHGHRVEAINILTKCRKLGDNVLVNNQLGQAYANIGHYMQSEVCFRRSANMVPGMLSQKFALFKLYEKTGNWKKYMETAMEIKKTPIKISNPEAVLIKNETQSSLLKYKKKKNEKQI